LSFCKECGAELRDGAKYCDKCGSKVGFDPGAASNSDYGQTGRRMVVDAGVLRSTKLVVSQQRLFISLGLIFVGIMTLGLSMTMPPMPSTPFGPADDYSMRNIGLLMGLGLMAFGFLVYFLGRADEKGH
jgi:hypothetical protein